MFDSRMFQPAELEYIRRDFDPNGIRAIRCRESELILGIGPREQFQELLATLGWPGPAVYLLFGPAEQPWGREGTALDPAERIPEHWRDPELAGCNRVCIFAGTRLTEGVAKVVECLLARQLGHVRAFEHRSRGPAMPGVHPAEWQAGYSAFLHLRSLAPAVAIQGLEPRETGDVASFRSSLEGFRVHGSRTVFDLRRDFLPEARSVRGPLYRSAWGDYLAAAVQKDARNWVLLAGSEIRKQAVDSASPFLHKLREDLVASGQAAPVQGFPDRLLLMVDLSFRSRDALNKSFRGGGGRDRWVPVASFGRNAEFGSRLEIAR